MGHILPLAVFRVMLMEMLGRKGAFWYRPVPRRGKGDAADVMQV